jgi:3-keto-L-gulonate-6-phosphate decarboxylase
MVCIHLGKDQQESAGDGQISIGHSIDDYRPYLTPGGAKIAVAGGLSSASLPLLRTLGSDVAIIGSGITGASDLVAAAKPLFEALHSHS